MAEVFRARDTKHGRDVAVKVLRPELGAVIGVARFQREIMIAANLVHPHILPLLDSGDADGLLYYVMPLVQGESLRERLDRVRQLSLDEALAITRQAAAALSAAHARGVVHRDIKPENLLLNGEDVLVADFGLASAVGDGSETRLTATGIAVGTPEYMAPEQAGSGPVDPRADQYALACVVYEMLTGMPPFTGATAQAVMARHAVEEPPPVRVVRRTVPDAVDAALRRALAKVPADRFPSVEAFVGALGGAPPARRALPWRRVVRVAAVPVILVIATLGVWAWRARGVDLGPRDWVLVGDILGPEDDRALGRAMRELVLAGLNQSPRLSTVPQEQLTQALRLAERSDTTTIDASVARELAVRTSVRVILTGGVSRIGRETYSIVLHAMRVADGATVFSEAAAAEDRGDALVRAVETLVRRTRVRLGEARADLRAEQPLMAVRTGSFPAFREYAEGIAVMRRGNWGRAAELMREAVALDSGFAAAWAAMGVAYMTSRRPDSAEWAFRHALDHRDRLSVVERYRLEGDVAFNLRRDLPAAIRWYDLALEQRPRHAAIHNNRGLYLSALGRHAEALEAFGTAAAIDPLMVGPRQIQLLNLLCELVITGQLDSARVVQPRLQGAPALYARLLLLSATDAWDSALVAAREAATAPGTEAFVRVPATTLWASALAATGLVDAAAAVLRTAAATATGGQPEARGYWHNLMLLAEAAGRPLEPLPPRFRSDTSAGGELLRGQAALAAGDERAARASAARLAARSQADRNLLGWGPAFLAAKLHARRGAWDSVLVLLREPAAAGEHDPFSLDRPGSLAIRWLVADAWARSGRLDSAAAMLERVVAPVGLPPAHYAQRGLPWAASHRRLATWYDSLGRADAAADHRRRLAGLSSGGTR